MNKILLIIKREYLSRVKKKSFILMTILGPILMVGIMIVPIWLSMQKAETQKVEVIDESFLFSNNNPKSAIVYYMSNNLSTLNFRQTKYRYQFLL